MSVFANALESADTTVENDAAAAATPEDETATSVISSTADAAQEVAQESADLDQLGSEQEELGEVQETIEQESAGLSPEAARYLNIALNRIVGKRAANKIIATENYSTGRAAQESAKRFALESISETLKSFWEAIKAQFKKVYSKVKDWIIKTFSAAKKLKERAEKIQNRANDTVGSIEEKSFSFSQTKTIAVAGKYNEAGSLLSGLNELADVVGKTITELKKDQLDEAIEKIVNALKASINSGTTGSRTTTDTAAIKALSTAVKATIAGGTVVASAAAVVGDKTKYDAQFGDATEVDVTGVFGLPGSKAIIAVVVKGTTDPNSIEAGIKYLKAGRLVVTGDRYNPRDVSEGDVKTLTTSQIDKVCDSVVTIAEAVYEFEKNWKENDKLVEKVQKEVDDLVKDFDQEDKADGTAQRNFRNFCNAAVGAVRRQSSFKAGLCSYGVTTSNAFLNYAEKSLAQHKAK